MPDGVFSFWWIHPSRIFILQELMGLQFHDGIFLMLLKDQDKPGSNAFVFSFYIR